MAPTRRTPGKGRTPVTERAFRFFDNREKYLMFVTTCGEKAVVASRIAAELRHIEPTGNALRVFDAGIGDGTVLSHVMRAMHRQFRHVPWLVVGKEISMEDVRLCFEKLADRFHEHPETVFVATNMKYNEAPWLTPLPPRGARDLNWHELTLTGDTAQEFDQQIRGLYPKLAHGWQVDVDGKSGNPKYVRPSVIVIYRKDRDFILKPLVPKPGKPEGPFDLVMASQPYRARASAEAKVRNVLAPLAASLAPGGRMIAIQSFGRDPGMEIIHRIWPDENPFKDSRESLMGLMRQTLSGPQHRDLRNTHRSDRRSLFQYHLHTMPSEVGANIGTSTLLAAWNAAVYVAQIEDARLEAAMGQGACIDAARKVVSKHGGLWFNDEAFVISRRRR